jgi:hypothetical protein
MDTSLPIIETINGRVQVSATSGESQLGLLVERDDLFCGVLLTPAQAEELARLLLNETGFVNRKPSPAHNPVDRRRQLHEVRGVEAGGVDAVGLEEF